MNINALTLAAATTSQDAGMPAWGLVLYILVILLVMYFLLIRPQRKKTKDEKRMRDSIRVGDEIVTIGGIYGRIISLKEDVIVIESKSDHSKLTIARWALQSNLTEHEDDKDSKGNKSSDKPKSKDKKEDKPKEKK